MTAGAAPARNYPVPLLFSITAKMMIEMIEMSLTLGLFDAAYQP
jgi:hypothetical protein